MNILGIPDFADMGLMSGPEVIEYLNDAFGLQEPFDGERQIPLARITRLLSLLQTDAVISDVQTRLQEIARNHQDEKVRRSALYSLAYLPLGEQLRRDGIVNFIIGSLQDESIEVQKQALAIVSSEKFAPLLHANQAKKILSNIDLPLTDWVFKQHIREAMQKIGRYSHDWDDMDDKPAILMFPGSFNPPHEGHLESAEGAAALVGREVWISVNAIEDEKIVQPFDIRCLMVRKSIADNPAVYLVPEYLMKDQGGLWIKSRRARVNQLIPFASDIGMVRGADVLENRSYTNLDSLTREIFHVICDRGDEAGTREVLRQLDLAYPVLHTELHSSTDVRILFAEGRVDQAFSQLHPLVAQYLRKHRLYG
jgi:nicotinic acid mononucleotide adenylyltransferase